MILTQITPQKHKKDRLSLFVDGEFALGVSVHTAQQYALHAGMAWDEALAEKLRREDTLFCAREAAGSLLAAGDKTESQITAALSRKGFDETTVTQTVVWLRERGYLNDRALADSLVARANGLGRLALKQKLHQKGVSAEDAEAALSVFSEEDETEAALCAAQSVLPRLASLPPREARAKLSQFLARRGFPWEIIRSTVDRCCDDDLFPEDSDV